MAQAKKKKRPFSATDKAIIQAMNWNVDSPEQLRENKQNLKQKSADLMSTLGMQKIADSSGVIDKRVCDYIASISIQNASKPDIIYAALLRTILLGSWLQHKVVYHVNKATIEFIQSLHLAENLWQNALQLWGKVLSTPLYIETPGMPGMSGCFVGLHHILPPEVQPLHDSTGERCANLFVLPIGNDADYLSSMCPCGMTVAETAKSTQDNVKSDATNMYIAILTYIAYYGTMCDAMGSVLFPDFGKPYQYYDVKPIPFADSIPDFTTGSGWVAAGLCNLMGYIGRQNMQANICNALHTTDDDSGLPPLVKIDEQGICDGQEISIATLRSVLDWENCKVVYQFSMETAETLYNKHADTISLSGFCDTLRYMPHNAIVLSNSDDRSIILIFRCKAQYVTGKIYDGVVMAALNTGDSAPPIAIFTSSPNDNCLIYQEASPCYSMINTAPVLYHILTVMQKRAQKRITQDIMSCGIPDTTALVPIEERTPHKASTSQKEEMNLRYGQNICEPSFELHEVTARTVKRIPQKDAILRGGWKMIPHIRRRHPHRYWVGKGEKRHLETRWLEPMHIHGDKKDKMATVVHQIKTGQENTAS